MLVLAVLVLLGTGLAVNSEVHSLKYIYTAFSKPLGLEGFHEFTAMGLLDNRLIDYFDSDNPSKVPKQNWMKQQLPQDYWEKGTQSRKSKQQWFKVNIEILMKRMNQSETDIHVLQWMHGCEGEGETNSTLKFKSGMDMYSYDGNDFLSFNDTDAVWVAPINAALPTKRKWDNVPVLKEYTKGYLKKECMEWLDKFNNYESQELSRASPPHVSVFAKDTHIETNIMLTCLATGFYPKDIIVNIKRNGRVLTRDDGLWSTGALPNEDGTHQMRTRVEILKSDLSTYTCHVIHEATRVNVEKVWDHILPPSPGTPIVPIVAGIVVVLVIVAAVVVILVVLKRRHRDSNKGSDESLNSNEKKTASLDSGDVMIPILTDATTKGSAGSVSSDSGHSSGSDKSLDSNEQNRASSDSGNDGANESTGLMNETPNN